MGEAAARCIRRRAFALLALVAITATVQASSAGAGTKKIPSKTSITVTQETTASLSISWQRVRTAAGYDVYLNGTNNGKTQATTYTFSNLRCGATYTLGVDAFTNKGVRSSIVSVVASTAACPVATGSNDTTPPTSPASLSQGATTATSISLLWSASLDNVGVAGYDLFVNGSKVGTSVAPTYAFTNLSCGRSYTLAVDAYDTSGNRSQSAAVQASTSPCADTSPPTTPGLPTQTGSTTTSISLLWSASLDNVGVAGYDLFVNGNKVGTTTATTYTFANLSCGTSYTLAVDAYDTSGNGSQWAAVQASTSPCADTSPPTTPGLPTQTGSTTTSISLLWSASLDNVGVAGYDLFVNGNKVGTTTATTYTFANLSCGTSYTLAVDAYDAAGNRSQRSALSGTTSACTNATAPPPPPPTNNCTSVLTPSTADTLDTQFNDPAKGNVVCLHGGNYAAASVFTGLTRSGTSSQRITLQSYPGELATIHGYLGIDSNWVMLTNLKIDNTNTFTSDSHGECPSGVYYGSLTVSGSNDVLDHNEIYASNQAHSANGVLVHGSNTDIRFNKIHDLGQCPNHDHGIYDSGTRTQVDGNWLWNLPNGWGVQLYPGDSNTHIYGNVIDGATSGFAVCSTGSNNLIENNVVSNSVGGGQAGSGSLVSGCGPQGSSTNNVVRNNDSFNNPGGFGSVAGITYSGNISADPQFVDAASHDYEVLPASPVLSWSLWTGS
jgi:parallel beta-helix repeat protein